jgi:hypothetical protein
MLVSNHGRRRARWAAFALMLMLVSACASVTIRANRRTGDTDTIDSVLFVLAEGNGPSWYPGLLKRYLTSETNRRGITARFLILTGVELDESEAIARKAKDVQGVVTMVPAGGTRTQLGNLVQILYDARAFRMVEASSDGADADGSGEPSDGGVEADATGEPAVDGGAPRASELRATGKKRREREAESIWRARINASGGSPAEQLQKIASEMIVRMIADHVLPGKPEE